MKAAVYYGPGDIRIEEIDRPKVEDGVDGLGMVMKVEACGICDIMDLPSYQGIREYTNRGITMGHEFAGEVVEVGPKVTVVKPGDRIYGMSIKPCLECDACRAGNYAGCGNYHNLGAGHGIHGAFAKYMLYPFAMEGHIVKLPDNISYQDGSLIEVVRLSIGLGDKAKAGDVVAIVGLKILGLATLARLKEKGIASKVIAIDTSKKRLEAAEKLGADVLIDATKDDIVEVVMKETSGKGAQHVLETTGKPDIVDKAIAITAEGNVKTTPPLIGGTMWISQAFETPWTLKGMKGGTSISHPWGTIEGWSLFKETVRFIQAGNIRAEHVVSHVFPLEKVTEAFETAINDPDSNKVIIEP